MPVVINGSTGISGTDGSASTPAIQGTDTNTGIFFPAADTIAFSEGGVEAMRIDSSGNLTVTGTVTAGGAALAPVTNTQTFDSSGTWTKPSGYAAASRVLVQAWGAGGSGGRSTTASNASGGGGGGYIERWLNLSQFGATETITIGAGGAARTATNQNGATGGNTTIGSLVTAYGGGGGGGNVVGNVSGGGGGGQLSAGTIPVDGRPTDPGRPFFVATDTDGSGGNPRQGSGVPPAQITSSELAAYTHGGGGGSGIGGATFGGGAASVYGGGGGGGNVNGAGGTSLFGGNGGAAGTTTGGSGTQPGGAGGSATGTSGAGAAGRAIITIFPA